MDASARSEAEFETLVRSRGVDESVLRAPTSASLRPTLDSQTLDSAGGPDDDAQDTPTRIGALPGLLGTHGSREIELESVLGEGGMGVVHLGRQVAMRRLVAVKTVRRDTQSRSSARALMREAWVTGSLEHPNVVPVYALGRDGENEPLLVMKRVVGRPWSGLIEADHRAGRLGASLKQHLDVLIDVCKAVHFANAQGVIHRDLKPENVMLGDFGLVYVVDWGLAVAVRDDADRVFPRVSDPPPLVGTPAYMAPEMADPGLAPLSTRTDVYLLGGMLHEILTGERPHAGTTMNATLFHAYLSPAPRYGPQVPAELATLARKALSRDPSERPESADAFKRALIDFLRHRSSTALSEVATKQAIELERAVGATGPGVVPDASEVQRLAAAARFGFEQALAGWPENPEARAGLQKTLELLLEHTLRQRDHAHAQRLLNELKEPHPSLATRVEELGHAVAAEQARIRALEQLERDIDVTASRSLQRTLVAVLAAAWTAIPFAGGWLQRQHGFEPTFTTYFVAWLGFVAMVGALLWSDRSTLRTNRAARQVASSLGWMLASVLVVRAVPAIRGESMLASAPYEMATYGLTSFLLATWMDRTVLVAGLAYSVGALSAATWPAWTFECIGVANGVALGTVAVLMWHAPKTNGGPREGDRRP